MATEGKATLDSALSHYATLADEDSVTRTAVALEKNGIAVTNFYNWQKQFFENGIVAFERRRLISQRIYSLFPFQL